MKYKIKIPTPCHENWNKMTPTQKGMFCVSCKKDVIDFTNFREHQLVQELKTKENICGRFKQNQLNVLIEEKKSKSISKLAATLALLVAVSNSDTVLSQNTKDKVERVVIKKDTISLSKLTIKKDVVIKGTVFDDQGGLPGASILLKGTSLGVETGFDGNFSIKIPNNNRKINILVVSYIGFKRVEIKIDSILSPLKIKMEESGEVLGMVTMGEVVVEKRTIFKRIRNFFRKKKD